MSGRTEQEVLQSIVGRLKDARQECRTFQAEAIYQAETARRAGNFAGESLWRQEAHAWTLQAVHSDNIAFALEKMAAVGNVNTTHEIRDPRPESATKRLQRRHQDMHA